jgi:hypothetical protein
MVVVCDGGVCDGGMRDGSVIRAESLLIVVRSNIQLRDCASPGNDGCFAAGPAGFSKDFGAFLWPDLRQWWAGRGMAGLL